MPTFRDIDCSFVSHPLTGDVAVKDDLNAIKQHIKILVFMNVFDLPFHPEIGGSIRSLLFNKYSPQIKEVLNKVIKNIVMNHETRIEKIQIDHIFNKGDKSLQINFKYRVSSLQIDDEYSIFIKRVI